MIRKSRNCRVQLGLEMERGLRGLTLSWFEVNTAYSATEQALKMCPKGCFPSEFLTRLHARFKRRRALNDIATARSEGGKS